MSSRKNESVYRIYCSDALKVITENTAKFGGGSQISKRFIDMIKNEPEDDRTEEEIIQSITEKLKKIGGS